MDDAKALAPLRHKRFIGSLFVEDVAFSLVARGVAGLAMFGYTFVCARLLGTADYGMLQAVMGIYGMFTVLSLSLNTASIHFVARSQADERPGVLGAMVRAASAISGAIALAFVAFSHHLSTLLHTETAMPFVALAGLVFSTALLTTFYGGVQGANLYAFFSVAKIAESFLVLGLGAGLVLAGAGVSGAIGGYCAGMTLVLLFFLARRDLYNLRRGSTVLPGSALRSVIKPLAVFAVLQFVANIPMLVARIRLSEEAAGVFGVLYALRNAVLPFALAIAFPLYSRLASAQREPKIVRKALAMAFLLGGAFVAVCAVSPRLLLELLFGPDFLGAAPYMLLSGLYLLVHIVSMVIMFYQVAADELCFPLLLLPVGVTIALFLLPDLSIVKILSAQLLALGCYLAISTTRRCLPRSRPSSRRVSTAGRSTPA